MEGRARYIRCLTRRRPRRIRSGFDTPAAVRFVSAEPLLEDVTDGLQDTYEAVLGRMDWVIVGGENGPGCRRMHANWARNVRDACLAHGVPFFFKQWGGRTPKAGGRELDGRTWDELPQTVEPRSPRSRLATM